MQVDTGGVIVYQPTVTYFYDLDPLKCTFGLANPSYSLSQESFCQLVSPQKLVAEVLKEMKPHSLDGEANDASPSGPKDSDSHTGVVMEEKSWS